MKTHEILLLLCVTLNVATAAAQAAEDDPFQDTLRAPSEQAMGYGRSAIWTLPLVATQYQPSHPTPTMQAALQAQQDSRFLEALILLDDARKSGKDSGDAAAELNLLRASFLLQGNQSKEAIESLAPLLTNTQRASDAYALTTMAYLQQGKMPEALDAAQHAHDLEGGSLLAHLALSYTLQASGRLAEARAEMHTVNSRTPASAITLAREAELALTLDQIPAARTLADQAKAADATDPYVTAVSGLVYLIDGHAQQAKSAFQTALKRDPKDAKALLGLGLAEIKLGNYQAGQEKLQAAAESDPTNALILTYLGRSQQQLGQTEAAKASWHKAQKSDPKDPVPWLYQAQAQLQANQPMDARESLREAQARLANRSVYRGEHLLKQDEQLLQANLAEVQRQLGMEALAFQTLSDSVGEKNSTTLRNQADVLQGQRFGESARRSLLLQSQFNAKPGSLPAELDIYGDGAGQTGASVPQHGVVSGLSSQQSSYNNYDELFTKPSPLDFDATVGSQSSSGEQIRAGLGGETLGMNIALRQFRTDGNAPFENLDNHIWQGVVQWQPNKSMQAFVSHQNFKSHWGATFYPADPIWLGSAAMIDDNSQVTRLGLRHNLADDNSSELRGLLSHQQTDQTINAEFLSNMLPYSNMPPFFGPELPFPQFSQHGSSSARSVELQYRRNDADYAMQLGMQQNSAQLNILDASISTTQNAQQFYVAWQRTLNHFWQLDAGLGWGKINNQDNLKISYDNSTFLARWLPQIGMVYTPESGTHIRLAAWQGMGISGLGDATLAPVSLAGVLLSRPGDNGKLVHAVALGGDRQLSPAWFLAAKTQQRRIDQPLITNPTAGQFLLRQEVDESSLALHWRPAVELWTVGLTYDYESANNAPEYSWLDSVQGQNLRSQQLDTRWFVNSRMTVNCSWSHNQVSGTQQSLFNTILIPYKDSFNQLDADLSWKFNGANGLLAAGVRNATNAHFQYTEVDKLNPRFSIGRLVYVKLKLGW